MTNAKIVSKDFGKNNRCIKRMVVDVMMYPYVKLNDNTEITHSIMEVSKEGGILNASMLRAVEDVRYGRNLSSTFSSVEELMEDLNAED